MRPSAMGGSLGSWRIALAVLALAVLGAAPDDAPSQIRVARDGEEVDVRWPIQDGEWGTLTVDLRPGRPTIARMGIAADASGESRTIASDLDPVTFVTVGSREAPPGRPPEMSPFNTFFDSPAKRPHRSYKARLDLKDVRVTNEDHRAMVALGGLQAGPFSGELQITVYAGSRLIHVQAVLSTSEDRTAFLYDAGLASDSPAGRALAWIDAEGRPQRKEFVPDSADTPVAVRHRAIALETEGGSVACFPPPHQFFFPRDLTDNQSTVWFGRGHRGLESRPGFGVRQTETGGGAYVPWFNAPPGTEQRLGVFYLLSRGPADEALREALRYTRGDRFADLPGHVTLSSHWHMAIAVAAMQEAASGRGRTVPDFVRMFKDMNVDAVHLAEFHGDGHPQDPGPLRLPELEAMFAECRRLSDDELLLLPGEEANVHLGLPAPGRHPGHWIYLFPRPVAWIMRRAEGSRSSRTTPAWASSIASGTGTRCSASSNASAGSPGPPTPGSRHRAGPPTSTGARTSTSPTGGSGPRGRRCRPTSPEIASASEGSTSWTTWPTGAGRRPCSARWTSSRSTAPTSSTAT